MPETERWTWTVKNILLLVADVVLIASVAHMSIRTGMVVVSVLVLREVSSSLLRQFVRIPLPFLARCPSPSRPTPLLRRTLLSRSLLPPLVFV